MIRVDVIEKQHFKSPPCQPPCPQPRRDHSRIVDHQEITLIEILWESTDSAVFDVEVIPIDDEHSGSAPGKRLLSNQFFREIKVKIGRTHRGILHASFQYGTMFRNEILERYLGTAFHCVGGEPPAMAQRADWLTKTHAPGHLVAVERTTDGDVTRDPIPWAL